MQSVTMSFETIHEYGDLWLQHLQIRKALFVDELKWKVPHNTLIEWDQYDTGNTEYVITHRDGVVLAASRMNPCSFDMGGQSYMIRDAALKRLNGLPDPQIPFLPTDEKCWEATRFTACPTLDPETKNEALSANARALAKRAIGVGAERLIALMHPGFARWLTRIALPTEKIGPVVLDAEGNKVCVLQMQLRKI
ncbi:acyl-homoserine-lactone synthase [Pseudovibrio exalbescens]|uniref:Acyl-homoserine-lactone synthase n=1 Tax=Pseudovibrio exalbescens TaxID=197461 RepID=A0A1U7JK08_9HYPH|nr:acyl-homoserine-lactone synthase [Pseudovibrio exalbescens]OKL45032.1 hypothetical protein A3843_05455 [Pseudovibrio exalbescens]